MAGKISNLTELTDPASGDELPIVDSSATETKKVTYSNLNSLPSGTQGDVLYHNGTDWVVLSAGTSGQFLQTQGAGANPQWITRPQPGFTLSAGESVNVGQPVTIGEGSTFTRFSETLGGDSWEAIGTSGIEKRRWQIYGSDIGDKFNQANLYVSVTGSPSDELQVKIWDAAYNNVLATGTITPATISGGSTPFAVTLDNVVASQDIYVELSRTGSLDGSNYFEVRVEQNDQYATDEEYWNGSSWASNSGWGWHLGLIYKKLTDYLYLSSATDTNDLDDTFGLTTESGSFGDNIFVINRGIVEKSGWG